MTLRALSRAVMAAALGVIGIMHLGPFGRTSMRRGFRIVVPDWATRALRTDKDTIVVVSGVVEALLGVALIALPRERVRVGALIAALFVAVFPGNIHQWRTKRSVPGLDTDRKRFLRLFLQPLLIVWAIWSTRRA